MNNTLQTIFNMFQEGGNTALLVLALFGLGYMYRDKIRTAQEYRKETLELLTSFRDTLNQKNDEIIELVEKSADALSQNSHSLQSMIRLVERWDMTIRRPKDDV